MIRVVAISLFLALLLVPGWSQLRRDPLTRVEVDQLRDTAWEPELRLKLFVKFARARLAALEQVRSDPKVTERAQETHDKLQDFLDVYDELNDNVDTYEGRKSDLRKAIQRINLRDDRPWLDEARISQAVSALERIASPKLMEANQQATDHASYGKVGGVALLHHRGRLYLPGW